MRPIADSSGALAPGTDESVPQMRALSTAELLTVWERGLTQLPTQRALALLAAACPDAAADTLAHLSIGQRDAQLLTLREWTFGSQVTGVTACPDCGERVELQCAVAEMRANISRQLPELLSVDMDDYTVQFRLPNSADLSTIVDHQDPVTIRGQLLARCLLEIQRSGIAQAKEELPVTIADAIVARMAQADPQADVQLALTCPQCAQPWSAVFDVVSFFWSELQHWAQRILREVHLLASAYGWREADIVAMSAQRRQWYVDMIGG